MPATVQHRRMTANALNLVPELPGPRSRLTEEFCLYPDQALNAPEEFARYCRLPSGEWFHYLPDVSYAELYRYHTVAAPVLSGTGIMTLRFPDFFIFCGRVRLSLATAKRRRR